MGNKKAQEEARLSALDYHAYPTPGKLEIRATKPVANPDDLSLAYSPGVAEACIEIEKDARLAAHYTARSNLVAVVSNGSAVLGLGNIGAAASKPVMEGKAILFKKFANIDCFDLEIEEQDPEKLASIICSMEPTFGAINLEDIKAPDCFIVEKLCKERMNIPVFHDDQHGTAIVVAAAALNALKLVEKLISEIRIVAIGAGAAGTACLEMLIQMGAKRENIWLVDRTGVVSSERTNLPAEKARFVQKTKAKTLADIIDGADMFLGLSGREVLSQDLVKRMANPPIIFALANPIPEIMPEEAHAANARAIIATGRSDYPNQVNNVLCFPFIFRGALDVGATQINNEMKIACVEAIASLALLPSNAEATAAYPHENLTFGQNYLIPKPFDARLLATVAPAVARAAIDSGVSTIDLDIDSYRERLRLKTAPKF